MYSIDEVARAAGVPHEHARALLAASGVPAERGYLLLDDAVRLVRSARSLDWQSRRLGLIAAAPGTVPRRGLPLLVSGAVHALVLAIVAALANIGGGTAAPVEGVQEVPRLVFLIAPGPGGGGGGGGQRQPLPAPAARLKGGSPVSSPVALARNVEPRRVERPAAATPPAQPVQSPPPEPEPAVPPAAPIPPVTAPVVSMAGDDEDEPGELVEPDGGQASRGPGDGNGVGSGRGPGTGAGDGTGIGEGSGGGTGGGPYRPGSGITPPSLDREVKPIYTEEARRRGVEGDVLLEVVVQSDGTVGSVRILRSLGAGLDERAVDAVRQWRFSPARRLGTPVDVLVEVAVTFRLR